MCIVHREEDQEISPGAHRNWCWRGLKFLHWILFRIGLHLGKNWAGWNSLVMEFLWFWILVLGAIFYRMRVLRLKCACKLLLGFHSLIDDNSYAVAFCPAKWTCRKPNEWFGIQSWGLKCVFFFRNCSNYFEIICSKLIARSLGFFPYLLIITICVIFNDFQW